MKELSIEQKAIAYDEAIKKLRNAFYDNNSRMCEEYRNAALKIIEPIFPELKESEDERIIKALRERIIRYDPNNEILIKEEGISQRQFLAWLEKQGQDGKVWFYRDDYVRDKKQAYQDGIDNVLDNPQKYGLEKQAEQKSAACSEEDVAMLDSAIAFVEHSPFTTIGKGKNNVIAWLKNLKDKVLSQIK